jgi:DNA-binding response OmpR family regulator
MVDFFGPSEKAAKAQILIVDDEPGVAQTIQERLEMSGYGVITASNGKEGLAMAVEEEPDIVLLDVKMPVMDGFEMLEALRKDQEGKSRVVMMVTVSSEKEDMARAEAYGVEDYIVKPFELGTLVEKVEGILERRKSVAK